jgi:hypothetical protein
MGLSAQGVAPSGIETVAQFVVLSNGSITQTSAAQAPIMPGTIGLTLEPGHETVLLFFRQISTISSSLPPYQPQSIIGGQEYIVQLITPQGSYENFNVNASYPG